MEKATSSEGLIPQAKRRKSRRHVLLPHTAEPFQTPEFDGMLPGLQLTRQFFLDHPDASLPGIPEETTQSIKKVIEHDLDMQLLPGSMANKRFVAKAGNLGDAMGFLDWWLVHNTTYREAGEKFGLKGGDIVTRVMQRMQRVTRILENQYKESQGEEITLEVGRKGNISAAMDGSIGGNRRRKTKHNGQKEDEVWRKLADRDDWKIHIENLAITPEEVADAWRGIRSGKGFALLTYCVPREITERNVDVEIHHGDSFADLLLDTQRSGILRDEEREALRKKADEIFQNLSSTAVQDEIGKKEGLPYYRRYLLVRLGEDGCTVAESPTNERVDMQLVRKVRKGKIVLGFSGEFNRIMSFALSQANLSAA